MFIVSETVLDLLERTVETVESILKIFLSLTNYYYIKNSQINVFGRKEKSQINVTLDHNWTEK